MITLTGIRGSAPGELGARAFVDAGGLIGGSVGGGKLEARAILHAQAMLENDAAPRVEAMTWNLTRDIDMTCGGEVSLLFEVVGAPSMHVRIFGAGHVAQALVRVLLPVECRITVVDHRPEWLAKLPASPSLDAAQVGLDELPNVVAQCAARDFFVVMTRGHATDLPILAAIFRHHAAPRYVGCMGSEVKARRLHRELAEGGVAANALARLHCPIGLAIGSNEPAEIALSVAAQLLQQRDAST